MPSAARAKTFDAAEERNRRLPMHRKKHNVPIFLASFVVPS